MRVLTCRFLDWWGIKLQLGASHMVDSLCHNYLSLMWQSLHMPMKASIQPPRLRPFQRFPIYAEHLSPSLIKYFDPNHEENGHLWNYKCNGGKEGPNYIFYFKFRSLVQN
jgi:hypothetical protein